MKTIILTQGKIALVDDEDFGFLNCFKWHTGKALYCYYAVRNITISPHKKRHILMHRVILNAPKGIEIDHINTDGLDNRRANLRLCNHRENARHKRIRFDSKSGIKGVYLRKGRNKRYEVSIKIDNKRIFLGCYQSAEEAARAYDRAAMKHYSEFALTNEMLGLLK